MTKAIRWSDEQLQKFQSRKLKRGNVALAAVERLRAGPKVPDPAPAPAAAPKKASKYRSRKVVHDGMTFDSEKELRRWRVLVLLQDAGHITELRRQVTFVLAPAVRLDGQARMKPALRYIADATYMQDGKLVVEDVKSPPTRKTAYYRAKLHLMATVHNIQIKEI